MDRFFVYLKNYKELLMKSVAVFKSSTSQAIRLPKDAALPESVKRVDIIPVGSHESIKRKFAQWFGSPKKVRTYAGPKFERPPCRPVLHRCCNRTVNF